ncbi:MAG: hypothetical protein M3M88_07110 [Thermoproteota archaeon]|nr:hypothetical protein [Thermoproteota archaeon]
MLSIYLNQVLAQSGVYKNIQNRKQHPIIFVGYLAAKTDIARNQAVKGNVGPNQFRLITII